MYIPSLMPAIEIHNPGETAQLIQAQRALPTPTERQALIKVAAAGLNRPDLMQRRGLYPPPSGASDIPGLEVAGTILSTGKKVKTLKTGDKVCALVTGGGYAGYCVASEALCLPIPKGLSFIEAAALPETFFTVWSTLFDTGHLKAGETLLVHGGSSGIGTTAIQFAKAFGVNILVTAGTDSKCDFCRKLGADQAINYRQADFVEAVLHHTASKGVNMVLDMIGGDYFPRNIKCLAPKGRLVQIAVQKGPKAEINLLSLMLKRLTLTGSTLRPQPERFKARIAVKLMKYIWPLLEAGKIKPVIDSTFPLAHADQAHARMEKSEHIGKIILEL